MGDLVKRPSTPREVLYLLNARFAPGEALAEMIIIQKEFQIFSQKYSLQQAHRLLNIAPTDFSERQLYYRYLERLKRVPSDIDGINGHDRIIRARQENLEGAAPLPVFTKTHRATDDRRVTVTQGQPIPHENQEYLVISIPTVPFRRVATPGPAPAGPKRRARRKTAA